VVKSPAHALFRNIRFPGDGATEPTSSRIIRRIGVGSALLLAFLAGNAFGQKITLDCLVLKRGGVMPKRYTAYDKNVSPPLVWSNIPRGALELALIFEDAENARVHWLLYRIPATAPGLKEAIPRDEVLAEPKKILGTIQGTTDFKDLGPGYNGPNLPSEKEHRYRFVLYALDAKLGLAPGLDKASLMALIRDHVMGEGELVVICRR
jgi:Raf kinase inhibitor-like YbhB/YbcL family protein